MKLTLIAVASTAFALSLSAQAEDMPGMKMYEWNASSFNDNG